MDKEHFRGEFADSERSESNLWTESTLEADLWTESFGANLWTERALEANLWTESALELICELRAL